MKSSNSLIALACGTIFLSACAATGKPIQPVGGVDLSRYMGRWYVIASIPTPFERGGVNAVETYSRNTDGTVCTWFRMRPESFTAPVKLLHSSARIVESTGNGEWQVRVFKVFRAQYLIGWLKADYSEVLVVRDARDYLWYMARTPEVSDESYQAMVDRSRVLGYDVSRIEKVPQLWPESGNGSDTFKEDCK